MIAQTKEKQAAWLAMTLCALPAVLAMVLTVFSDSSWKIPLLILIPLCFIAAEAAIFRLHEQLCTLRGQVARLRDATNTSVDAAQDSSPKGVYSVDDDGKRRLHISRLE